ncbi:cupredoxin domain-containing protein [Mesorhizobium sp. f-mel]
MSTAPTVSKRHLWIAMALTIAATSAKAETIEVTIEKLVFSPASIEAKVGDTIEWVNKDVFAHTATVTGGWEVMIPPKTSASLTLKRAGSFDYFCRFHPNMKGQMTVTSP